MVGRLEVYVGSMFAEKTTQLIRQGKRHLLAGRNVVFIKPMIDGRYSDEEVVTHDGDKIKAISVSTEKSLSSLLTDEEITDSDVVCIDEIQFFSRQMVALIELLINEGKIVYVAGLDMDRFGEPFGIVPHLMAVAEKVTKVHAVCGFCGEDAWLSVASESLKNENDNRLNIGNDYIPSCRRCVSEYKRKEG